MNFTLYIYIYIYIYICFNFSNDLTVKRKLFAGGHEKEKNNFVGRTYTVPRLKRKEKKPIHLNS
jgi:hypothetical protein